MVRGGSGSSACPRSPSCDCCGGGVYICVAFFSYVYYNAPGIVLNELVLVGIPV